MTRFFEIIYPGFLWKKEVEEKIIYLTFDDGPIPEVTPWVLDRLAQYDAKATFFCVGENITKHPEVFKKILDRGHKIGNHTYKHLNGWKNDKISYLSDFQKFEQQYKTNLFRPPYGRIRRTQFKEILKTHQIVMWSVLTRDYSSKITPESCLSFAITRTKPGSIILFHDSLKAQRNMSYALPRFLKHFHDLGYVFESL